METKMPQLRTLLPRCGMVTVWLQILTQSTFWLPSKIPIPAQEDEREFHLSHLHLKSVYLNKQCCLVAFWCTAVGLRLDIILILTRIRMSREGAYHLELSKEDFQDCQVSFCQKWSFARQLWHWWEIMPRIFISMAGVPARRATILLWFWSIASIEQSRLLCHTGSSLKNNHPCHFLYATHTHMLIYSPPHGP